MARSRFGSVRGGAPAIVLVTSCFAVASSCKSAADLGIAQTCSLNSDCNAPLICVFARCHEQCSKAEDCPSGERCVASGADEGGAANVCELALESNCGPDATCQGNLVCSPVDQQCRMACAKNADCLSGQYCVAGLGPSACYQPGDVGDVPALVAAGVVALDGAIGGDTTPDGVTTVGATGNPEAGATGVEAGPDGSLGPDGTGGPDGMTVDAALACDVLLPDGGCNDCPAGACAHGVCVSGPTGYTCNCFAGYAGTGSTSCTLVNACLANDSCAPDYPCQPTAPPGEACLGEYAAWPMPDSTGPVPPAYSDNQDGTITDTVTGLTWPRDVPADGCAVGADGGSDADAGTSNECTLADARAYCASLHLGGFSDWRLPAKIELESLLDCSTAEPPYIGGAFQPTPSTMFWTASTYEPSMSYNWVVLTTNCGNTEVGSAQSGVTVRCVRGTGIGPSTSPTHYTIGAVESADAGGDAGPLEMVTDNWTGLKWQRTTSPAPMTATDAATYCAALAPGFRLPTLKELMTLVDPIAFNPAIDTAAFPGTASGQYWTSTPFVPNDGAQYALNFADGGNSGLPSGYGVTGSFNVRCVQ